MILSVEKAILLGQINLKRSELFKKAQSFGLTHPDVIACSQELDILLNKYQGIQAIY